MNEASLHMAAVASPLNRGPAHWAGLRNIKVGVYAMASVVMCNIHTDYVKWANEVLHRKVYAW